MFELEQYLLHGLVWLDVGGVDCEFGVFRFFVGVGDAGEFFYFACTGFLVEALAITLFADFERCADVDFYEAAVGFYEVADFSSGCRVGGDGGADGDAAVFCYFGCDEADSEDVQVSVFLREAEFAAEILSDDVTIQESDLSSAEFHQLDL